MKKAVELDKLVGKKIYGYEDIYQFSTGGKVKTKKQFIGIMIGYNDKEVNMYLEKNPKNYQNYSINLENFKKWFNEGLYKTY